MGKKGTQAETIVRAQRFARIIANGGRRSDCVRYASENWGVGERSVAKYLQIAIDSAITLFLIFMIDDSRILRTLMTI